MAAGLVWAMEGPCSMIDLFHRHFTMKDGKRQPLRWPVISSRYFSRFPSKDFLMDVVDIRIDPFPSQQALSDLWRVTWEIDGLADFRAVLKRSLTHVAAFQNDHLIGFANMAWDGGVHAFLVDVCVHPDFRDHGIGQSMVEEALKVARQRGIRKVHVDFEPHLRDFYLSCGFAPTDAGVLTID